MVVQSNEISVVVQGAIDKDNTAKCLKAIRQQLPQAEIILSTWEGSDTDGLDYDSLVLNKDPGGFHDKIMTGFINNLSRQLVSTQNGLKQVSRPYVLKMRSDLIFTSAKFLHYFEQLQMRDEPYQFFDRKVIGCSFFSKKYLLHKNKIHPVPFHVSDWITFGLATDIKKLYEIPLPKPTMYDYFFVNAYKGSKVNILSGAHQYAPEQYIAYTAFSKQFDALQFDHYMDYNNHNIKLSERLIANNFILLPPSLFGFYCGKINTGKDYYKKWSLYPWTMPYTLAHGLYRFDVVLQDYQTYCQKTYRLPFSIGLQVLFNKVFYQYRYRGK